MSLPIYLLPHKKEIIEELKLQGADDKTIEAVLSDFKGKKRELELLKYLKENRNNKISFNDLIARKIEIKNKYDEYWGYVLVQNSDFFPDCYEEYNPEEYLKQQELKKYKHLEDYEISEIFNIKERALNNGEHSLGKIWEYIKKEYSNHEKSKQPYIDIVLFTNGKIKFNPQKLICIRCGSKYVGTHLYGDVSYRLFNGTEEQKKQEKEKFEKFGLYDNPSPYGAEDNDKTHYCLGCGYEW